MIFILPLDYRGMYKDIVRMRNRAEFDWPWSLDQRFSVLRFLKECDKFLYDISYVAWTETETDLKVI